MLPDTGERYLSTPLFDGIDVDMNEAELALSRSTPGYRFDAPRRGPQPGGGPAAASLPSCSTPSAEAFVTDVVRDHGVVMFALEWCEFCWAVRKLFGAPGHRLSERGHRLGGVAASTTWAPRSAPC